MYPQPACYLVFVISLNLLTSIVLPLSSLHFSWHFAFGVDWRTDTFISTDGRNLTIFLSRSTLCSTDNASWFKLSKLSCLSGHAWVNMSRMDCLFRHLDGKKKSFKVSCLHIQNQMQLPAGKQAIFTTDTHTRFAQHDRWDETQRSAVSRVSLRQDSDSFTSPWLRRWSWPKQIFSTVTVLQNAIQVSNSFKEVCS